MCMGYDSCVETIQSLPEYKKIHHYSDTHTYYNSFIIDEIKRHTTSVVVHNYPTENVCVIKLKYINIFMFCATTLVLGAAYLMYGTAPV